MFSILALRFIHSGTSPLHECVYLRIMKYFEPLCLCALWTLILVCACSKPDHKESPSLEITTSGALDIPADNRSASISFTSNNPWTASSSDAWCTVNPASGPAATQAITVTLIMEPNEAYEPRTAIITIEAGGIVKTVAVTQVAAEKPVVTLQAVDMGLSVLWADRNLGADSPTGLGDYYAWGETKTKDYYDWSTYKWCNGAKNTLTKYNTREAYGTVDNLTQLALEDDAAWVNTDGEWRMPTDAEVTELRHACSIMWATVDGVGGCWFTSNTNGNKIFVPAAGGIYRNQQLSVNSHGNIFSSTTCSGSNYYGYMDDYAWYLYFDAGERQRYGDSRASGWTIRPVKDKKVDFLFGIRAN